MRCPVFTEQEPWIDAVVAQHDERFGQATRAGVYIDMVITDVDDVVLDADKRWHEYYADMCDQPDQAVPLEAFRTGYRQFMEPLTDDYDALKTQLIHDPEFHINIPLMPGADVLPGRGKDHRYPHGYITTRPAVLGEVTADNLERLGLHAAPLLVRSEQFDYASTIDFKVRALVGLRRALDPSPQRTVEQSPLTCLGVHYIDDYKDLVTRVNQVGQQEFGDLYATHYTPPLTWAKILRDELCLNDDQPL